MQALEEIGWHLLAALGEDPKRPGLQDTPARWARMWREFIGYHDQSPPTTFEIVKADQLVLVRGMRIYSLCEHHLLPFWSDVAVGYVTRDRVLGLSKLARIAHQVAHRLQLQERLVEEIGNAIEEATGSPDVAVVAKGRHLCLEMRGIKTPAEMVTSVMRGAFRDDYNSRAEFLGLAQI